MRHLFWLGSCVALFCATAQGAILVSTPVPQSSTVTQSDPAPLTRVEVGSQDVAITGFGTYGSAAAAENQKFIVFHGDSLFGQIGATLVYQSSPVAVSAGGPNWYDSPATNLTLSANQIYYIGMIASGNFTYEYDFLGNNVSGGGLTLIGSQNGNATNYASPVTDTTTGTGNRLISLRIMGVPEPTSLALIGLGGIGLLRRRK